MNRTWKPSLHPRGPNGRFTRSGTRVMTAADKRRARRIVDSLFPEPFVRTLRRPRPKAVIDYFAGGWRDTNRDLRAGKTPPNVAEIDKAMEGLRNDVVLTRTIPLKAFGDVPMEELAGMKVRDAGYASTALRTGDEPPEERAVRLHLAVPAGTPAVVNDDEVLLARGTEVAIGRVAWNGTAWDLYGAVLPGPQHARPSPAEKPAPRAARPAAQDGADERRALADAIGAEVGAWTDEKSGLTTDVDNVTVGRRDVRVVFAITDRDGVEVGHAERVFGNDGVRYVEHEELVLDEGVQGTGFAARFNARNETFYRQHGIEEIRLSANLDVGGYAWARAGYDWDSNRTAESVAFTLSGRLGDVAQGAVLADPEIQAWPDNVKGQARDLIGRVAAALRDTTPSDRPGEGMPTPLEFAMLGWTPGSGSGRAAMWPGKQFMLTAAWAGQKPVASGGQQ